METEKTFLKETLERAVKTAAQSVVLLLTAAHTGPLDATTVDWKTAAGIAAGGAFLSVMTSLASFKIGPSGSASVVTTAP
jgi:hypothetical protein